MAQWFRAMVHSHNPQDRAWFAILPYVGEILVLENGQQGSTLRDKKTPKLIPPGDADPKADVCGMWRPVELRLFVHVGGYRAPATIRVRTH